LLDVSEEGRFFFDSSNPKRSRRLEEKFDCIWLLNTLLRLDTLAPKGNKDKEKTETRKNLLWKQVNLKRRKKENRKILRK
jgi:hypothetical protein